MRRSICLLSLLLLYGVASGKTLFLRRIGNIECPDKEGSCPDETTCCQLSSGKYGCCPFPDAACCDDHEHCCPSGYTCDVPDQKCLQENGDVISWSTKTPALSINNLKKVSTICPDQQSQCGDGQTCCLLASGQYGCCPYPQAVCCDDYEHCCPNGYTCDVPDQQCLKANGEAIPWSKKTEAKLIVKSSSSIICPDQQSQCGDGQTCCRLASGQYGCCPYPQAVCCSDQEHCCPNGYQCDVPHQQCVKANGEVITWSKKTEAKLLSRSSSSVICPDQQSQCGDGQTCCQLQSGDWGCCPYPQAVCCSDQEHCCPNGYQCDVPHQQCVKANEEAIPWSKKIEARMINRMNVQKKANDIVCPDQSSCNDGETCCLISSTTYGCCPLSQATCCNDFIHCCPHSYSCDLQKETCVRGDGLKVPWTKKSPPKSLRNEPNVCWDQKTKCRDGSTCCSNSYGETQGCCPFENGVCCSDGLHCCPANSVCDADSHMCQSNMINMAISWSQLDKVFGAGFGFQSVKADVKCPDQKSECPADTTCCQMQSGLYGCCPFSQALCCEDKLHCCPSGFKCDTEHSRCVAEKFEVVLPWEVFGRRKAKTVL